MLRQSLTNFAVLLVCTWIVFSGKVQGILLEEVAPCRELLARIPITFTDALEVNVNLTKLQECINLWMEWRAERVQIGGFSVPSPKMLTKELDRMLTQQARQIAAARPTRPEQFEQPNVAADVHQPLAINRKRNRGGQERQPEAKRPNMVPPVRPWRFVQSPLVPLPNRKLKSQPVAASNKATAKRPLSPEKVKQPNEVAGVQQPQSSVASIDEVRFELRILQKGLPISRVHQTLSSECMKLIEELLVTPNSPIPIGKELTDHHKIMKDCAKVWEKLLDKAVNDHNKKNGLERELDLIKHRFEQIKEKRSLRDNRYRAKNYANERTLKDRCIKLAKTLPHNPRNLATMVQMLEYKDELDECIAKWKQLAKYTRKRARVDDELELLNVESTRVEHLIGVHGQDQGQQNVAAGLLHVEAPVQVETDNRQRPSGSNNRNFDIPRRHRSKHSKMVRNRMAKSKPKWSKLF